MSPVLIAIIAIFTSILIPAGGIYIQRRGQGLTTQDAAASRLAAAQIARDNLNLAATAAMNTRLDVLTARVDRLESNRRVLNKYIEELRAFGRDSTLPVPRTVPDYPEALLSAG